MQPRLYADNAATSFPKPPCVFEAMQRYAHDPGASAGRGAYREVIQTRPGIHCAPLAHQTIGTTPHDGTTRLSFGAYNTVADVERCTEAMRQLAHAHLAAR